MGIAAEDLLAGPIVRRVEPTLVAVWVALRKPATLRLELYRGVGSAETLGPPIAQVPRPAATGGRRGLPPDPHTIAVGVNLHIGMALWEPEGTARLDWGALFSYDLWLTADDDGPAVNFAALDLLRDRLVRSHHGNDHDWLALGYTANWLPSFRLPPPDPLQLRIAHGSCRWATGEGADAMPIMDEVIGAAVGDPAQRPHMLWLTGDQIYADANGAEYGQIIQDVARELMSTDGSTVEHMSVRFEPEPGARIVRFPLDALHFPMGRRRHLLQHLPGNPTDATVRGLTSDKQDSHMMGFSEYCANYLTAFANTLWPDLRGMLQARWELVQDYAQEYVRLYELTEEQAPKNVRKPERFEAMRYYWAAWRLVPHGARTIDDYLTEQDRWTLWDELPSDGAWGNYWRSYARESGVSAFEAIAVPPNRTPATVAPDEDRRQLALALTPLWMAGRESFTVEVNAAGDVVKDKVREHLHNMKQFHGGLARVRRLLANVATYMVFDDHEMGDDWNITAGWVTAVRGNVLGREIMRNAMAAFLLFQGWGNDPRAYLTDGVRRRVLERISRLFVADDGTAHPNGDDVDHERGANLEALDRELDNLPLWEAPPAADERIHWHFRYDAPGLEILALDTRTWRSFEADADPTVGQPFTSEANAPLMTDEALHLQIPPEPPASVNPGGLCIVISAVPVLGMPPVESLAQPLLNLRDIVEPMPEGRWAKHLAADRRGRINYDPEPWGYVPRLLEALLERLSSRRRVVFLSGDVHYSVMLEMAYWRRQGAAWTPTRFVQCTGSSYRAPQPASRNEYFAIDLVQQIASEISDGIERLGWRKPLVGAPDDGDPVVPPAGARFNDRVEYLFQIDPILLAPRALPPGTVYATGPNGEPRQPDWAWRMNLATDLRPDDERLIGQLPPPLLPPSAGWAQMLQSAANRVLWSVEHATDRRWMWFTNATIVDFISGDAPEVRQSVYSWDLGNPSNIARPFMVTRTRLDVPESALIPTVPPPEPSEDT